ncbi:MAG: hypothetical protein H0T18_04280 [Chloroflexia bacterium]|nr:hypothetical protein [Chloroflexia bacterium]
MLASIGATSGATSDLEAEAFAEYAAESAQVAPLVEPFAGSLIEAAPDDVPLAAAGVSLADFAVVASFINPSDVSTELWGAGFQFRGDATETNRIAVRSDGKVYLVDSDLSPRLVGTASSYDPAPDAANQFQHFVRGDLALFGINGAYVASIPSPAVPLVSDVEVGTTFFAEDFVQDRVTTYEGFSIWQML